MTKYIAILWLGLLNWYSVFLFCTQFCKCSTVDHHAYTKCAQHAWYTNCKKKKSMCNMASFQTTKERICMCKPCAWVWWAYRRCMLLIDLIRLIYSHRNKSNYRHALSDVCWPRFGRDCIWMQSKTDDRTPLSHTNTYLPIGCRNN